jgi:hypothetical protein
VQISLRDDVGVASVRKRFDGLDAIAKSGVKPAASRRNDNLVTAPLTNVVVLSAAAATAADVAL